MKSAKLFILLLLLPCLLGFSVPPANQISLELTKVGYDEGYQPEPGFYTLALKNVTVMGGYYGGLEIEFEAKEDKITKTFNLDLHSIVKPESPEENFAIYSRWDNEAERALLKMEAPNTPFSLTEKDFEYEGPADDVIKGKVIKINPGANISLVQNEGEGNKYQWGTIGFDKFTFNVKSLSAKNNKLSMTIEFEMSSHRGPTYKVYEAQGVLNISNAEYSIKHAP